MIRVSEPLLGQEELTNVLRCVKSGWISSSGEFLEAFEAKWAAYCGRKYGVAVSNGTTALELAVAALRLGPGDEVIVPTFTIISCVRAIIAAGATPVLVDAEPRTLCMDVSQVAARITQRTRAIMAVHIYGHPVDMDPILSLASRHGLAVIEDAAEAHGAEYLRHRRETQESWQRCGGFGDVSVFSFYANKIVTTGEGGMVLCNDEQLARRLRSLRNLSFGQVRRFEHEDLGHNYRLTNIQAAIGVAQVDRIQKAISRKRQMAALYAKHLADLTQLTLPVEEPWARSVYWMYGIRLGRDCPLDAAALGNALSQKGIETRPFFLGMHEQPALHARGYFRGERHPVAEEAARRGLYLPSGLTLSDEDVVHVAETVREVLR